MALKRKKKIKVSAKDEAAHQAYSEAAGRDADFSELDQVEDDGQSENEERQFAESDIFAEEDVSTPKFDDEASPPADDFEQKYLRALADLENFKKRTIKERSDLLKYQGERVFTDMLEIIDNFELALQHAEADPASLKDGVQLIYKMLTDVLSKWEVRAVEGLGEKFDPNKQNAISKLPSEDTEPGTIINELKKAYFYKDKLIRAGEVVVSVAPEKTTDNSSNAASDEREEDQAL